MKSIEELAAQLHGSEPNRVARENGDRWLTLGQVHRVLELIQKCGHVVLPPDEREFGELRDPVVWLRWMALGGGTEAQERRYRAAFRQCADIIEQSTARIEALESEAERNFRWAYALLLCLAKAHLAKTNAEVGDKSWPGGQAWDELVGVSHAVFLRMARDEAGIPHDEFLAEVHSGRYDMEDLYDNAARRA